MSERSERPVGGAEPASEHGAAALEERLGGALTARAATTTVSDDGLDRVRGRVATRRRRRSSAVGLVTAVALLGGGVGIAALAGRDGPAERVVAAVPAPAAPVDEDGLVRFLPGSVPAGFELDAATEVPQPPPSDDEGVGDSWVEVHRPVEGAAAIVVETYTRAPGDEGTDGDLPLSAGEERVDIGGSPGSLFRESGDAFSVGFDLGGLPVTVNGHGLSRDDVLAAARSVTADPAAGEAVVHVAELPPGFERTFAGDPATAYGGRSWRLDYVQNDLDRPFDATIGIGVSEAGDGALELAIAYGRGRRVEVRGLEAYLDTQPGGDAYPASTTVSWLEDAAFVTLDGSALAGSAPETEAALLAVAEDLEVVDDAAWRDAVGDRLVVEGPYEEGEPTEEGPREPLAEGEVAGQPWRMEVTRSVDDEEFVCAYLTLPAGESSACGPTPAPLVAFSVASPEVDGPATVLFGLADGETPAVGVEDGEAVVEIATTPGPLGSPLRSFVAELPVELPSALVAFDPEGAEVLRVEWPFGEPDDGTAVLYEALVDADFTPVASGTMAERPWALEAADAPTSGGGTVACGRLAFAGETSYDLCGWSYAESEDLADLTYLDIVTVRRRVFVVAKVGSVTASVTATFEGGRTVELRPAAAEGGAERFLVVPVERGDVLTALLLRTDDGTELSRTDFEVAGDPDDEWSVGPSEVIPPG